MSCLVHSALTIMRNETYQTRFYLEPDYIPYELTPHDGEIYILIGEVRVSCDLKRYARQILKMFDGYLFSHGIDEYVAQWYYDYPKDAVEQLRTQLRKIT